MILSVVVSEEKHLLIKTNYSFLTCYSKYISHILIMDLCFELAAKCQFKVYFALRRK